MPTLDRLPGRLDGPEGLIALAEKFPPEQVYDLIVSVRTVRGRDLDAGGAALTALANTMITREMEASGSTFKQARRAVARRLGYHDEGSRANFYKIVAGGRAPDKRPHSTYR